MKQLSIDEINVLTDFQKRLKLGIVTNPTARGRSLLMSISLDVEDLASMPLRDLAGYLSAYNQGIPLEVVSRMVRESDPLVEKFGRRLWSDMADPNSKYYLGGVYKKQAEATIYKLEGMDLMASFPSKRELDPLIDEYLEKRGGMFIKSVGESGRNEVRRLLIESYRETGTWSAFDKKMREEFSYTQKWKRYQIYQTEHGLAANSAYFNIADQIKEIDGFNIILGSRPCPWCQYMASFTHKPTEERPTYHPNCVCLCSPYIEKISEHVGRRVDSDPLSYMKENEYLRLKQNYANFQAPRMVA